MKDWVMVRITRKTQRRLQALRELSLEQREKGRVMIDDSSKPGGGLPTWDAVIRLLLDRDEKHRARARKQANKKRGYTNDPVIVANGVLQDDHPFADQAEDVIDVVPDTPIEKFRHKYAFLAAMGQADYLDSMEYRRVFKEWLACDRPDWDTDQLLKIINAMPPGQ